MGRSLIDEVDGFIGQITVIDVPDGMLYGADYGFIANPDLMIVFILLFDTT